MEQNKQTSQELVLAAIVKFRTDLLWDETIGIFETVPEPIKKALFDQYYQALRAACQEFGLELLALQEQTEEKAFEAINGCSFSKKDVVKRLAEYGIR